MFRIFPAILLFGLLSVAPPGSGPMMPRSGFSNRESARSWAGEFGRTPYAQSGDGRDHNNKGYSLWMAGGGVKGGHTHGATDDFGYQAVVDPVHIHDWHATILHLLGLDHRKLTFNYGGRNFTLSDVDGEVVKGIVG